MLWAAWMGVLAGLWSIVAPFALGYSSLNSVATTEAVIAGFLIGGFSLWLALADYAPPYVDYLIGVFGLWSAAAPFVLAYRHLTAALDSDIVVGIVAFVAAIVSIYYRSHHRTLRPTTV